MAIFLVGGAVRDRLLGRKVEDRDWVVTGSTPDAMIDAGYTPVGKDFPVFLHPQTHEEYALARRERKSGTGYHGFVFDTSASVTLEEDLGRRDLTINAMAQTADGRLIDPYGGADDLRNRTLRHVSPAFAEDPVRVLRVARFMARFAPLGFRVAESTRRLMSDLVTSGEIDHLVPERVWHELERALAEPSPRAFIETLRACGALAVLLPELDRLFGVPQPAAHHPEIDAGLHSLLTLDQACLLDTDPALRFAALCHDLGKGTTPESDWPYHAGHEARGADLCAAICQRLRAPKAFRELGILSARWHGQCHAAPQLSADALAELIEALDTGRRPQRFRQFLRVCEADARGRPGFEQSAYPQAGFVQAAAGVWQTVDAAAIASGLRAAGPAAAGSIPQRIRASRLTALREFLQT